MDPWHRALTFHQCLANRIMRQCGRVSQTGPFRGMTCITNADEGCLNPKLLGSYEEELESSLESFISAGYDRVIDVGCASGYFVVGLALRLPHAQVFGFDLDEGAISRCKELIALNKVESRITLLGGCTTTELQRLIQGKTLLIMDCDGPEYELLDPKAAPALRQCDIIVECHDHVNPAITNTIQERFRESHAIELIPAHNECPTSHDALASRRCQKSTGPKRCLNIACTSSTGLSCNAFRQLNGVTRSSDDRDTPPLSVVRTPAGGMDESVGLVHLGMLTGIYRLVVRPMARTLLPPRVRTIEGGLAAGLRFSARDVSDSVFDGTYERRIQKALRESLKPGDVFFDIGANVGFFTLLGAKLVEPAGSVHAFEPVPRNVETLRRNVRLNGWSHVHVHPVAVAATKGEQELLLTRDVGGASLTSAGIAIPDVANRLMVPTVAIDDLVERGDIPPPSVVKVDVEGAELGVLQGMQRTMAKHRPALLYEVDDGDEQVMRERWTQLDEFVSRVGYQVARLTNVYPANGWFVGHTVATWAADDQNKQ